MGCPWTSNLKTLDPVKRHNFAQTQRPAQSASLVRGFYTSREDNGVVMGSNAYRVNYHEKARAKSPLKRLDMPVETALEKSPPGVPGRLILAQE